MKITGLSVKVIRDGLRKLEAEGLIDIETQEGRSSIYRLLWRTGEPGGLDSRFDLSLAKGWTESRLPLHPYGPEPDGDQGRRGPEASRSDSPRHDDIARRLRSACRMRKHRTSEGYMRWPLQARLWSSPRTIR
jgi:hypothetical protein